MSLIDKLFDKSIPEPNSGCIIWLGACTRQGYGRFWTGSRLELPHRFVYEWFVRILEEGEQVLHRCDNPYCVNHNHLFVGDNTDNYLDKMSKGRQAKGSQLNRSRLNEYDVREIRRLVSSGIMQKDVAAMYNISTGRCSDIVNYRQWRYA